MVDLNIKLIKWICSKLNIKTKFICSSELDIQGSKAELLFNICNNLEANHYLSPAGSKGYIEENNLFLKNGIRLSFQNFKHPTYNQLFGDFIPYLSVIDLLFNEGEKSLELIKSGSSYE